MLNELERKCLINPNLALSPLECHVLFELPLTFFSKRRSYCRITTLKGTLINDVDSISKFQMPLSIRSFDFMFPFHIHIKQFVGSTQE